VWGVSHVLIAIALFAGPAAGATILPDQRAYELVSPGAAKNGADLIALSSKTHASADGNAAVFAALNAFGPAAGTSADVEYLSRRDGTPGTSGWSTRAINPAGGPLTFAAIVTGNLPSFEAAFTPDLSSGIFRSWRPLTDAPNVADVSNLYRLSGLGTGGSTVQLLTPSAAPLTLPPGFPVEFMLNAKAGFNGASKDLSHVIFQSPWNLADGSLSFPGNLYEYADGAGVRLVGRVPSDAEVSCDDLSGSACVDAPSSQAGIPATDAEYSAGMISEDGARILFQTPAGGDSPGTIYMREDGTRTFQLNASEKRARPAEDAGTAQLWGMSADGSRVFFITSEGLVDGDDDGNPGLYMYDRTAPEGSRLTLLSANGGASCAASAFVGTSRDGHYVYFVCAGQLVAGEPAVFSDGLFLWHDGAIRYIGTLSSPNEATLNSPRTNWLTQALVKPSRLTPDGRFLLFGVENDAGFRGRGGFAGYDHGSGCPLTASGTTECRELYLYDAETGRLVCASCNVRSGVATGDAVTDTLQATSGSLITQHSSHALSDDGRRVFFNTTEALTAEDSNGRWDAYEYDVPSGTVHLLSTGKAAGNSFFLEATASGDDVFLVTRERLVGWDVDDNYDLYDARVGGGFPDPVPAPSPCAGEACRSQAAAPPAAGVGGSAHYRGPGNARARLRRHRRCKRRAVLRRVRGKRRCIRRRSHRAHRRAHKVTEPLPRRQPDQAILQGLFGVCLAFSLYRVQLELERRGK
jgi:hypothetical protein